MAPLRVVNRGFGGALIADLTRYADRIVLPLRPRAVVVFAGTNDIAGPRLASPRSIVDGFTAFAQRLHAADPETPVFFVAITPTAARWSLWPVAREANRLVGEYVSTDPRLRMIDLTDVLLASDGTPDRSLLRSDGLHPNKRGYERWAAAIKPVLEAETSSDGRS